MSYSVSPLAPPSRLWRGFCSRFLQGYPLVFALSAFFPIALPADVANLPVVADTFINSGLPDNNAGANLWFDAGTDGTLAIRRGLLRFDLSGIPPGSTLTSAVLQLTVSKVPASPVSSTFDLLRLTTAWNEGAETTPKSGAPAATGESTWNARMQNLLPWTAPGAKNDVATNVSASAPVSPVVNNTSSWSGTGLVADVQLWVDNPALNFGWLLASEAEATARSVVGFAARESGSGYGILRVGYSPPAPLTPPVFTSIGISNKFPSPPLTVAQVPVITNGWISFQWQGDSRANFDLLYTPSVASPAGWSLAQPNIAGQVSGSNFLADPPYLASPAYGANTNLFYRLAARPASAPGLALRLAVVATNLVSPTVLTHAHDGSGRLFIADQPGQVWVVDNTGAMLPTPFLDISNRMVTLRTNYDERGLLGLAFHPGYSTNGRFFVYYAAPPPDTNYDNMTVLAEFRVSSTNGNLADPESQKILLTIPEPEFNHEGAAIVFGPDGDLYLGPGDGGGAGDQHGTYGNGQMLDTFLGKILRIDVDRGDPYAIPADNPFVGVPEARPEIYAYGLRNPWRFSFDRGGDHQGYIADVGQNLWEEIDILRKGGNYGWRILEGNHIFDPTVAIELGTNIAALDFPIFEYGHGPMGIAIIGGFVYRGALYPELSGQYVFGDFSTSFGAPDGQLYYLTESRPGIWERFSFQLYPSGGRLGRFVKGFGEDEAGELYLLSTTRLGPGGNTGDVRKLIRP